MEPCDGVIYYLEFLVGEFSSGNMMFGVAKKDASPYQRISPLASKLQFPFI